MVSAHTIGQLVGIVGPSIFTHLMIFIVYIISRVGYKHISYEGCGWEACANDCKKEHKQIEFGNKKCWIASVELEVHKNQK